MYEPDQTDGLPLDGLRVVDFTHFLAGPHCSLWLASLGAEVIKIESPSRPDPFRISLLKPGIEPTLNNSPMFAVTNLMKRSCCIDISQPAGQELCHELVQRSDIVTANYRSGVLEGFNLGYETLSQINPSIIMAMITAYGYDGDYAAFQGLGPNIHAYSGFSGITGYRPDEPGNVFGTYGDIISAQVATLSILAAIGRRELTGQGALIDLAMSEALIMVAPEAVLRAAVLGEVATARANDEFGFAPHNCYPCAGVEHWIAIAVFDDIQWRAAANVLGIASSKDAARFGDHITRWEHRAELDQLVASSTQSRDVEELAMALQEVGVAAAPSRTAPEVLEDEQLRAAQFFGEIEQDELGSGWLPKLPWRIKTDGHSPRPMGRVADFGTDTRFLLTSILGIDSDRWDELVASAIVI